MGTLYPLTLRSDTVAFKKIVTRFYLGIVIFFISFYDRRDSKHSGGVQYRLTKVDTPNAYGTSTGAAGGWANREAKKYQWRR
jgi:hypothetical protein